MGVSEGWERCSRQKICRTLSKEGGKQNKRVSYVS